MKRILFIIVILSVLFACSTDKTPDYVIPQDKMIDIIADIHLVDGMMTVHTIRREILRQKSNNLYDEVFTRYGYTRTDFDTSIYYYSLNINQYDAMYKEVLNKLSEKEAKIKEEGIKNKSTE
jgi:hypothetical protein